jgi:cytochrome c oxidase assembly factor CtaG
MAIPPWRAGVFAMGLGALWIAVAPPLRGMGHELVSIHMAQHILLGAIAPPLIWLGAPILPLWLPRWFARRMRGTTPRGALGPVRRFVTHPLTAWLAATVTVIGWHVPAAFELAQRSELWHQIQNASFFTTGLLFWWPVIQPWPAAEQMPNETIPLYLFAATLPCDALSAFLVFCDRVVYRHDLVEHHHFGMTALADQQTAGAIMWVSITFIYLAPALLMTVHALSSAQQRSR